MSGEANMRRVEAHRRVAATGGASVRQGGEAGTERTAMKKPHIPLGQIRSEVEACKKCALCEGRTQIVFGVGNPRARVMIVGEAPGKNEDLQGEPFVGAAGQYLNELLAFAGLVREDVYRSDYEAVTAKLLFEYVPYEAAASALQKVVDSGLLDA